MKHRMHLFIVVMLLITAFSYAGTLPTYDVVELNFDTNYYHDIKAINNSRQMVGVDNARPYRAFLYENGVTKYLDDIVGTGSCALDINDIGQIIGYSPNFCWLLYNGQMTRLVTQEGYIFHPKKINNKGQIAGNFNTPDGDCHAALWENGTVKDLGLSESKYCYATDINDNGQIIGCYSTTVDGKNLYDVFLYENNAIQTLDVNSMVGNFYDLNKTGQIIVNIQEYYGNKSFFWEDGQIVEADAYNIYDTISDMGQLINSYYIWTEESDAVLINDLIPDKYKNMNRNYYCINTKGELVFKFYDINNAYKKPFLLVPSVKQAVIPPLFSYKPGVYSKQIEVKITCPTDNAVIHYTTNGKDPAESDPTIESGGTMLIDKDTILKAKAWRSDCVPSGIRQSTYYIRAKTWKGLAMVAIPTEPSSEDPKLAVGFSSNYWYTYNPVTRGYAGYPDQYTWLDLSKDNTTRAFWAKFDTETPVSGGRFLVGNTSRDTATILLKPGWNMIGQPFISPIKWDELKIDVGNHIGINIKQAGDYVYPYLWGWKQSVVNPYTGSYYRVGDPSMYPDAVDTMQPFEGYWIKAKKECKLEAGLWMPY